MLDNVSVVEYPETKDPYSKTLYNLDLQVGRYPGLFCHQTCRYGVLANKKSVLKFSVND